MADLKAQLENAFEKAAEYQLLSCLAVDPQRREKYRARAKFQYSIADELRTRISTQNSAQEMAKLPRSDGRFSRALRAEGVTIQFADFLSQLSKLLSHGSFRAPLG